MAVESAELGLKTISYRVGGKPFSGFLADGSRGRLAPGVLVAHEGPGITDHIKRRTKEIAALGYVAFALDLYGAPNPSINEAKEFVRFLRGHLDELRRRMAAAFEVLKASPNVNEKRIAAVGFCFGGTAALELARSGSELACVVGFHAGLDTTRAEDAKNIRGPILICLGANDPIITEEKRRAFADEMTAGGVDWRMIVYGGAGHSFTNKDIDAWNFPGFAYNERADRRSWAEMCAFFQENLA